MAGEYFSYQAPYGGYLPDFQVLPQPQQQQQQGFYDLDYNGYGGYGAGFNAPVSSQIVAAPGAPYNLPPIGGGYQDAGYYVDRKSRGKRLDSNNSPDESIRLVQRRKSNTLKDKVSVGATNDKSSQKGSVSKNSKLENEVPASVDADKASNKGDAKNVVQEEKVKDDKGKSNRGKSKDKKHRKSKREVFADDYYVPGAPQYASDPYQGQYLNADPYFGSSNQYQAAGGYGNDYDLNSLDLDYDYGYGGGYGDPYGGQYGQLVTIGPRTDLDQFKQEQLSASAQHIAQPVFSNVEVSQAPLLEPVVQPLAIEGSSLPPGSKIIAEYILGYLEGEPEKEVKVPEKVEEKKKKEKKPKKHDIVKPTPEKPKEEKPKSPIPAETSDLSKLRDEIINTIQSELNNLKLKESEQPAIQPIFLMPKQSEGEQKPIYIPRNVYVPVIRPVFVPRERIIVKPQIIHVARPVLVDRPVPVQQKPIVIERDRPVPVRVETVEKIENIETTIPHSNSNVVIHEHVITNEPEIDNSQNYQQYNYTEVVTEQPASNVNDNFYQYASLDLNKYYNDPAAKFIHLNEEVTVQANNNESNLKSSADVSNILRDFLQVSVLDANAKSELNVPSYTLEVYDSTVSDKFEKVDANSLKNLGYDAYAYVAGSSNNQYNVGYESIVDSKVVTSAYEVPQRSDSFKSITQEFEELKKKGGFSEQS